MNNESPMEPLRRVFARSAQIVIDLGVLSAAFVFAFLFRFEFRLSLEFTKLLFFTWPYVVLLQYLVLVSFGVPRFAWRYVGLREASRIFWAVSLSVSVLVALRLGLADLPGYAKFVRLPLGVLAMDFILAFLGVAGVRVLRRIASERGERAGRTRFDRPKTRTLLLGAGRAGVMVARELASRPDLGIEAVGFLDDDPVKVGTEVHGIAVLGPTAAIAEVAAETSATEALITIANASGEAIRAITMRCQEAGLEAKIIPGIYEIVGGQVNLSRIREVDIEDLLGREPVELDQTALGQQLAGKVVMVTGAGGSIGSELCRQILRFSPARLLLVERTEFALFQIHRELRAQHEARLLPLIADVTDAARMQAIFEAQRPQLVFHAAAHKHVPMMEWNPAEAVKNNVGGTQRVAQLAQAHGVQTFVLVSTDKAVNPTSVMGATKRVAELQVQALAQGQGQAQAQAPAGSQVTDTANSTAEAQARGGGTAFVAVRFGNVLGSAGSVIPIFKQQIAAGGPVTVTHPAMRRYFMTIPEASQLILQAGAMGEGGETFVLDMGEPVLIVDVARDLIRLSGLEPERDIKIAFTGLRPGEKLFEELSVDTEQADKTKHPKIFVGKTRPQAWDSFPQRLDALLALAHSEPTPAQLRAKLKTLVPEYQRPKHDEAGEAADAGERDQAATGDEALGAD